MPTIAEVLRRIQAKSRSVEKKEAEILRLEADLEEARTVRREARLAARGERDRVEKRAHGELAARKLVEAVTIRKKIAGLRQARQKARASLKALEARSSELREGVARFARASRDYLVWWRGAKSKLEVLVAKVEEDARGAETALAQAERAVDSGRGDVAHAMAEEARGEAAKARADCEALDELISGWQRKEWAGQADLSANSFGVEPADVAAHVPLASKVQETFAAADLAREEAQGLLCDAEKAAMEAETLAAAGARSPEFFARLLAQRKKTLHALITSYGIVRTTVWGATIDHEGARFSEIAASLRANGKDPSIRAGAARIAEQAFDLLPKALERSRREIEKIDRFVSREVANVPEPFRRTLKTQIEELRTEAMVVLSSQRKFETKYQKAQVALAALEAALDVSPPRRRSV